MEGMGWCAANTSDMYLTSQLLGMKSLIRNHSASLIKSRSSMRVNGRDLGKQNDGDSGMEMEMAYD